MQVTGLTNYNVLNAAMLVRGQWPQFILSLTPGPRLVFLLLCILLMFGLGSCELQDIDKEISELKMSVNTRGRLVAGEFLKQFI